MRAAYLLVLLVYLVSAYTLTDALGYNVTLEVYPPERVVALTPALSEAVCVMDCAKLVGTVEPVTYPPELVKMVESGKVAVVGSFWNPSIEKIVALAPHLVLADAGSDLRMRDALTQAGLKVFFVKGGICESVSCVARDMELVGKAIGEPQKGKIVASWILGNLTLASRVASALPKVKYVALFYPYRWGIYAVGKNNFISDMIDKLNAVNLIDSAGWPRVPRERLAALSPDVVLVLTSGRPPLTKVVKETLELVKAKWVCVVYSTYADVVERPGPRLSEAPLVLLNALHVHINDPSGLFCYSPR
ncbi:MAG: ABC transporter substrate-binding protein [Crenarchaeota archaeon]|nr:ABC transporter substrate-binding protein [Thermoproteota archaeon]